MTQLSPHASALLMCLSGPPQRAYDLRTQIGWPEDRFARALSQLVNSYPPMIEIFGNVDDHNFCPPRDIKAPGDDRYEHGPVHAAFRSPCRLCQEDATVRTSDDPAADMRG